MRSDRRQPIEGLISGIRATILVDASRVWPLSAQKSMSAAPETSHPIVGTPSIDRIALCLSGGGYRAALFHLGALRRLNELGVLSKVDMICSVSGGSILAGHLVLNMRPWPQPGQAFADWPGVENKFRLFVKRNIRTWPVLKRFLAPWNWVRPVTQVSTGSGGNTAEVAETPD